MIQMYKKVSCFEHLTVVELMVQVADSRSYLRLIEMVWPRQQVDAPNIFRGVQRPGIRRDYLRLNGLFLGRYTRQTFSFQGCFFRGNVFFG